MLPHHPGHGAPRKWGHHGHCYGPNQEQELYSCCVTTHSHARGKRECLVLRERRLFNAAARGDIPKTQLFSIRQQPCQGALQTSWPLSLCQHCSRAGSITWHWVPQLWRVCRSQQSLQQSLQQSSLGNWVVQAPLPYTDQRANHTQTPQRRGTG